MASPPVRLLWRLFFTTLLAFGSCGSFGRTTQHHEFPVLHLNRRGLDGVDGNQTLPQLSDSCMCNFTQEYLLSAAKTNCSNYITPLERSIALPTWDQSESIASFANCTYHEIATRFADFPDGIPTLVFHGGSLYFTPKPNMSDALAYPPPPAIDSSLWDQLAEHPESVPFLPILQDLADIAFAPFDQDKPSYCTAPPQQTNSTTNATISTVAKNDQKMALERRAQFILQLIDISTQQYTRCTVQTQPATEESVKSCVTASVAKLNNPLPSSLFIYFGASQCDSKTWSFVGVALSITLELAHLTAMMYLSPLRGDTSHTSFSWLQSLIKLASGLGEPAIQAVLLQKANSLVKHTSSAGITSSSSIGFVLAAMEFLQPTAAPLVAAISGWWFSKGFGFQVMATEAITTLLGFVMILGFTTSQFLTTSLSSSPTGPTSFFLAVIGLLCAVGPWAFVYLLFGLVGLPLQIGFILWMVEICLGVEDGWGIQLAATCLAILIMVVGFVGLTPVFAIWEGIWVGWKKFKEWRGKRRLRKEDAMLVMAGVQQQQQQLGMGYQQHELHAQGSKEPLMVAGTKEVAPQQERTEAELFPLARHFRRRFQNTSRLKRGFVKCVFWTFITLSLVSFVGKWMFMANILTIAGDVSCPNGYKEATWGGLGFKAGVLLIGVVLEFFGLTA